MLYIAAALVAALVVVAYLLAGLLRAQQRAAARERDLLLNQILHLAGRPWQPSPSDTWQPQTGTSDATGELADGEWPVWAGASEQEPVY